MSLGLTLKIKELSRLRRRLETIRRRVQQPRSLLGKLAILGYQDVQMHFRREEGPGGKWAPLKPATIKARRKGRGVGSAKILQDTGILRLSVMPETGQRVVSPNAVLLRVGGLASVYAGTHQYGDRSRHIPARPFFWISRAMRARMATLVGQELVLRIS